MEPQGHHENNRLLSPASVKHQGRGRLGKWKPPMPREECGLWPMCSGKSSVRLAFGKCWQDGKVKTGWKVGPAVKGEERRPDLVSFVFH